MATTTAGRELGMKVYRLPLGVVRACPCCKHTEIVRTGISGVGRGYGMREGNKARGRMIQHIRAAHPKHTAEFIAMYWS